MGVPYESAPKAGIDVAGVPHVEVVEWPHRSRITKVVVTQTTGVPEAFTVALYNHPQVSDGVQTSDSISDPDGGGVGAIPDDHYRVSDDLVAGANGKLLYFSEDNGGYGFGFFSQKLKDGRQGQRDSKLYVKITPTGGGAKKFVITIGGEKEVE